MAGEYCGSAGGSCCGSTVGLHMAGVGMIRIGGGASSSSLSGRVSSMNSFDSEGGNKADLDDVRLGVWV